MIDEYKSRASKRKVERKQQEKSVQSKKRQLGQIQETSPIINGLESNLRLGMYTIKPLQVVERSRRIVNNPHI